MKHKGLIFKGLKNKYDLSHCRTEQDMVQGKIPETGKWVTFGKIKEYTVKPSDNGNVKIYRDDLHIFTFHRPILAKKLMKEALCT